ncbi:MAG TPA: hypothetical protein VL688_07030 [Verrucomicrobiae bacterium]|nr:hypothetical protein [Verrucomicrobiae bacterium]
MAEGEITAEQLAEQEDQRRRRQALAQGGGTQSMKELKNRKEKNDKKQNQGYALMMVLGFFIMVATLGGMAALILSLKHS